MLKIWLKNRKNGIRLTVYILIIAAGLTYLIIDALPEHKASAEDIRGQFDRIDASLGDEWNREYVTEYDSRTFADPEGNTIIYYVCKTTYYAADPAEVTELNIAGIRGIIDPDSAESRRPRDVNGKPGMIYEKRGRAYLCWTDTPEYSLILEYTPGTVTEAEIVKMAESVKYVGEE